MKSVHIIFCSLITIILCKQILSKPILNNSESELDSIEKSSVNLKENQLYSNINKRWKRGYFYGYEYKGPYSPHDSDEYESDASGPKSIDETLKEGGFADPESGPDVFSQAKVCIYFNKNILKCCINKHVLLKFFRMPMKCF